MNDNQQAAREWLLGDFDEWRFDGLLAGISVGPVTLCGYKYGQERGHKVTIEQKAQMIADAHLIHAAQSLLMAAEFALTNLMRNLHSEEVCGQPFMGDDEHQAIAMLSAAIAKAHPAPPRPTQEIRGD